MVGYIELGHIDRAAGEARLELPLVSPVARERWKIGVQLLRQIAEKAFRDLTLLRLIVLMWTDDRDFQVCCHSVWSSKYKQAGAIQYDEAERAWVWMLTRAESAS